MAVSAGLNQEFFLNGYDLSADIAEVDVESSQNFQEIGSLTLLAIRRLGLLSDGSLTYQGWFNDATDAHHDAIKAAPVANEYALWCFNPIASTSVQIGDPCVSIQGVRPSIANSRGSDGSLSITVELQAKSGAPGIMDGLMLTTGMQAFSSAADNAAIDYGAGVGSTAFGARFAFQILNDVDSGTLEMLVEDSTNNSVWATLLDLGDADSKRGGVATVTGNVDRYIRFGASGTFTNGDVAVAVRRGLTNDIESLA